VTDIKDVQSSITEVDGSGPRIRWGKKGNKYQLIQLAREGLDPRLPGKREVFDKSDFQNLRRVLVYGERSGGGRDFLRWLRTALGTSEPWIFAQGDRWTPSLFEVSDRKLFGEGILKDLITDKSFLTSLLNDDSATAAGHIVDWASKYNGKKINLLIRDLGRLSKDPLEASSKSAGQRAALALSKAAEFKIVSNRIRLVLVDTSEDNFKDTYDASGLARLCWRFRLPWFGTKEVSRLAGHDLFNICLAEKEDALDEFMMVTGGQPLLVQSLLRELEELEGELDILAVQRGYRWLRDHPPSSVERWKKDLANSDGAVLEALKDFTAGGKRSKEQGLLQQHVSLFYSGWIRFDELTRNWKISSMLHGDYAQAVLGAVKL
jgi:hypothetical protein